MRRPPAWLLATALLALVAGGLAGAWWRARPAVAARTVVLVARDMAFFLAADPDTPNPVLHARPGERLRLVLEQRDPGFAHDLRLPDLGLATAPLERLGARSEILLRVPERDGDWVYDCSLHPQWMRGTLRIGAAAPGR